MSDCGCSQKKEPEKTGCGCGPTHPKDPDFRGIKNSISIKAGNSKAIVVTSKWTFADYLGRMMVRLGFNRMNYAIRPGLYALGKPESHSPVLVSANYKLSFDLLRKDLAGQNLWILVLDTKGVNVWCAAGKGTFGTKELVTQIIKTGLDKVVNHKEVIVPQLGAPGVAAHLVQKHSKFKVIYGPVRAKDIITFLQKEKKCIPSMRQVNFPLADRMEVTWLELSMSFWIFIPISIGIILIASLFQGGFNLHKGLIWSTPILIGLWASLLAGTVFFPALLPILPGRSFSIKASILGTAIGILSVLLNSQFNSFHIFPAGALLLFVIGITTYLGLNFTGSSTYTSLSGVKKETAIALPILIAITALSLILFTINIITKRSLS